MGTPIRERGARPTSADAPRRERATVLAAAVPPDLLVLLFFLGLALLGRILRTLQERAARRARGGSARAAGEREPGPSGEPEQARGPAGDPNIDELEQSGADLWRRLLEGLEPGEVRRPEVVHVPAPPAPAQVERSPQRPVQRPAPMPAEPPPGPPLADDLPPARELPELAQEPVLSASDLDAGREASSADEPHFVLSAAASDESLAPSGDPTRSSHPLPGGVRDELWRAVLWSEILAPPLALRAPQDSLPAGAGARSALSRAPGEVP